MIDLKNDIRQFNRRSKTRRHISGLPFLRVNFFSIFKKKKVTTIATRRAGIVSFFKNGLIAFLEKTYEAIKIVKENGDKKVTLARWQVKASTAFILTLGICIGIFFATTNILQRVKAAGELTNTWDFSASGDYTVSDSSLIEVLGNTARLKVRNYETDADTVALYHFDESSGNASDSSGNANTLTNSNITYSSGNFNNAGSFDGQISYGYAADSSVLDIVAENTIEAWIKLTSTFNATSNDRDMAIVDKGGYKLYFNHLTGKLTYELEDSAATTWSQVAGSEINNSWDLNGQLSVSASTSMGTSVFVGLGNAVSDAEVWQWSGGTWTKVGGDGVNDSWTAQQYEQVLALANDGTNVYVGLGLTAGDAEVWRWDGAAWTKIGGDGVNSSWTAVLAMEGVYSLDYYGGNLYAGLGNSANDAEVWRWNGTSWTKIGGDSLNSGWTTNFEIVHALVNDGTNLYAGLGLTAQDAEVWRWNGTTWTRIGGDGVNSSWAAGSNIERVWSLSYYGGNLYAGTGDTAGDGDVWRWNGTSWSQIGGDALNSGWAASTYEYVYSMTNDGSNLYVGLGATAGDNEVWGWNGTAWTKIGGDALNSGFTNTHTIISALTYNSSTLYAGQTSTNQGSDFWSFNGTTWTRIGGQYINSSWGYYNRQTIETAEVLSESLYVGTGISVAGSAQVWDFNGSTWNIVGGQGVNSSWAFNTYENVLALGQYDNQLIAGLGITANDAETWRFNGTSWTQFGGDSLNSGWTTNFEGVYALASDGTYLYAGLGNSANDAEVWRWNGTAWTKIGGDSLNSGWTTNFEAVYSLAFYNNQLYAGLGASAGDAEVWRWNGSSWTRVGGDAVNSSWANAVYETVEALAPIGDKLYAGLGNSSDDAEVWEYNGSTWTLIGGDDVNSSWPAGEMERIRSIAEYNGDMYVTTGSAAGDGEVWRYDFTTWTKVAGDDLNNSWASNTAEHATFVTTYKGKLYTGTGDSGNVDANVWSYGNNAVLESATNSFNTDWRHVAATYNGTAMKIYINGVEDATTSATRSIPTNTLQLRVGTSHGAVDSGLPLSYLAGQIDELRISDTARSTFITTPYTSDPQTVRPNSAVFTSGVLQWDSLASSETANGGSLNYRLSSDGGTTWQYWNGSAWTTSSALTEVNPIATITANVSSFDVTTDGFMWQAVLDGDGTQQATLNSVTLVGSEDATAPNPPSSLTALDQSGGSVSLTTDTWYNYATPYFSWSGATDPGGSGIEGYYVYFGTDNTATPSTAGTFQVGTTFTPSSMTSNSTYYLRIQARDNAQNVSSIYAPFNYQYDGTAPTNPSSLTALPPGYTATNSYTFYWTNDATDTSGSGVAGYQYSINGTSSWSSTIAVGTTQTTLTDIANEGPNTLYMRTIDNTGNVTSTYKQVNFYFAGTAPTEPQNLIVTPSTNTANAFAFDWDAPSSYTGMPDSSTLTYCYTVNTLPSASTCTFTAEGISALSSGPYANQPGSNTLYVAAMDEVDNINYDAYASVTFTANTSSPGVPLNVEIADVSVKETESWKLALSWEPPTTGSSNITYEIYHSTDDSSYTFAAEVSGIAHIDTNLAQATHYYKVRACDTTNNCGIFTTAVSAYPDGRYTTAAELTSGPTVSAITTKQATITWATDRTSDSKIQYGKGSGDFFDEEPSNSDQLTDHTITLTNLSPGTRYYFQAKWTDEDGNTGTSEETTFETAPAPTVTDPKAIAVNLTTATIRYTVEGATKIRIYYGETQTFGSTLEVSTSTSEATYNTILEDLKDGTKYFYKINGFDSEAAEYEGSTLTFETLPRPKISEVKIQQVRGTAQPTVLISWKTNTETSSIVTYYPSSDPSQTRDEVNVEFVLGDHKILIRGLQPETPYTLIVKGRDKNGNEAISEIQRITTATDTRAPQITDLIVEGTDIPNPNGGTEGSSSQLVISWTTDEPSTSQVEYGEGTGTSYPQRTQEDKSMVTNHAVVISNLVPSRVYHFRVISRDKASNAGLSVDTVTITPKASDNALDLVINNLSQIFGFLKTNNN